MPVLAVIPSDPIEEYLSGGFDRLMDYYNPRHFFDKVYVLSPLEKREHEIDGLRIIPTKDKQLPSRLNDLDVDLVRAYGGNWPCDMACDFRKSDVPVVVSLHDRRLKWFRPSLTRADMVIAVSDEVKRIALRFCKDPRKVRVLPNKVDMDVFRPFTVDRFEAWGIPKDVRAILSIGRLSSEKNLDVIFKALSILGSHYRFIAAGVGDSRPYEALARECGVEKQCYFIGPVPRGRLPELINAVDCVCHPSHTEAMSKAVAEAMACGAVIVTSSVAAAGVGLQDGFDAFVMQDENDPKALASALSAACNDKALCGKIRERVRISSAPFSKTSIESLEVSFYGELMAAAAHGKMKRPWWDGYTRVLRKLEKNI
jgi:glycosyltransferase involved in cell wall biosynthesis